MEHLLCIITLLPLFQGCESEFQKCSAGSVTIQQVTEAVEHGEGPHWDPKHQVLYFVDISNQTVNRYNPADGTTTSVYIEGGPVSPVVPSRKDGHFFIGRGLDLVLMNWDGESKQPSHIKVLTTVDRDKPKNRFNDGKADASGRLWIGTMGPEDPILKLHQGSLFSFPSWKSFAHEKHLSGVSVSNGIGWNHNDTLMYYIDSPTRNIDVFDFDLIRGSIRNRRLAFSFDQYKINGVPDGMTVDSEGMLWVAVYNGGAVLRVDPNVGALLQTVLIPVTKVTSCAFGGTGLSALYVTTSRRGLTAAELIREPLAGSVFALHGLNVKGQRKTNSATLKITMKSNRFLG